MDCRACACVNTGFGPMPHGVPIAGPMAGAVGWLGLMLPAPWAAVPVFAMGLPAMAFGLPAMVVVPAVARACCGQSAVLIGWDPH